jgi:hypothetical protein
MPDMNKRLVLPSIAPVLVFALLVTASIPTQTERQRLELTDAAVRFLNSLSPSLRAKALLPFEAEERFNWHYIPRARKGVSFKDMTPEQRSAALTLVRSALSAKGYEKTTAIIALETILGELERNRSRDPELYYMTIFGSPSMKQPWGWRLEGHHLSLNFTAVTNELVAATPAFLGAHPATIPFGPDRGKRILAQEEDLAYQLMNSLSPEQRAQAVIATTAPRDLITRNDRRARMERFEGIPYAAMNALQQGLLLRLIGEYINTMREDVAERQLARINRAGFERIHFAWAGMTEPGSPHYYRIHGPTFLIELDNTQDGANHIHSVWRDFENDFGEDVLKRHYETSPHHRR